MAVICTKLKTLTAPALAFALACAASFVAAQTVKTNSQVPVPGPAVQGRRPAAPQVVTVVHRLNGIKVLRLLLHSGAVGALDTMDESFSMSSEVHTNILAGLALDDGETIAVWLPEAEVEVDARQSFTPTTPPLPRALAPPKGTATETVEVTSDLTVTPELMIIGHDGKKHPAQYVGLDGITGLSLLKISEKTQTGTAGQREAAIVVKQRVRLFAPEPVPEGRASSRSAVSVRIGETGGTIVSLKRGPAGEINRIRMRAPKLSTANVGGIAINDAGQTIGIVTGIEGNEAVILPPAMIRAAAQRVLARKGSVPRPWLGVSGESLAFTPFEKIVQRGWEPARVALLKNQGGIFLTSIAPGSPAEMAALRAGDVIVRVNNSEVKSADDFSLLLEGAGESPVLFTIVRPNHSEPESVSVKLSEVFEPWSPLNVLPTPGPRGFVISPLIKQGIETMPLRPAAAARLNVSGGLFVIYVQPQTPAAKAGLQPTDIIEAINGQPVMSAGPPQVESLTGASYSLSIIRDKQKLVLIVNPTP